MIAYEEVGTPQLHRKIIYSLFSPKVTFIGQTYSSFKTHFLQASPINNYPHHCFLWSSLPLLYLLHTLSQLYIFLNHTICLSLIHANKYMLVSICFVSH